jgi:hypothetical protein
VMFFFLSRITPLCSFPISRWSIYLCQAKCPHDSVHSKTGWLPLSLFSVLVLCLVKLQEW